MEKNTLSIRNFRGIEILESEYKRVNIILGKTNSGKTTILEALALCGIDVAEDLYSLLLNRINFQNLRYYPQSRNIYSKELIKEIFYSDKDEFEITIKNKSYKWKNLINTDKYYNLSDKKNNQDEDDDDDDKNYDIQSEIFDLSISNKSKISKIRLKDNYIKISGDTKPKIIDCRFNSPYMYRNPYSEDSVYAKIIDSDLKENIIEKLKNILNLNDCDDLNFDFHPKLRSIILNKRRLQCYGESTRKLISILAELSNKNHFLCFDELDAGLDFTSKNLIADEFIKNESNSNNIFFTTHDPETIEIFLKKFSDNKKLDEICVMHMDQKKLIYFSGEEAYNSQIKFKEDLRG